MIITFLNKFNIEVEDNLIKEMEKVMPHYVEFATFCVEKNILELNKNHNYGSEDFRNKLLSSCEIAINKKRWGTFENYLYECFLETVNRVEGSPFTTYFKDENPNACCATCGKYVNHWVLDEADVSDWCLEWDARMADYLEPCGAYLSCHVGIKKL